MFTEDWKNHKDDLGYRLQLLQNLECQKALEADRQMCQVEIVPFRQEKDRITHGVTTLSEKTIGISLDDLKADEPYRATDTLFHEAGHRLQKKAVEHYDATHEAAYGFSEQEILALKGSLYNDAINNDDTSFFVTRLSPWEDTVRRIASRDNDELYTQDSEYIHSPYYTERMNDELLYGSDNADANRVRQEENAIFIPSGAIQSTMHDQSFSDAENDTFDQSDTGAEAQTPDTLAPSTPQMDGNDHAATQQQVNAHSVEDDLYDGAQHDIAHRIRCGRYGFRERELAGFATTHTGRQHGRTYRRF